MRKLQGRKVLHFPASQQRRTPADDRRDVSPEVDPSAEASGLLLLPGAHDEPSRFPTWLKVAALATLLSLGVLAGALVASLRQQ